MGGRNHESENPGTTVKAPKNSKWVFRAAVRNRDITQRFVTKPIPLLNRGAIDSFYAAKPGEQGMLDDGLTGSTCMTEPSLEELQESIDELGAYRERLETDIRALGQKLRMPPKKVEAAVEEHAELQRICEILAQLERQRDAMTPGT